uniref:Uncharacterized protein n=1 Tax=Pogonatum inflexum TaxID=185755 RepID=A0A5J6XIT6_9BRYO|nr:hypothetical protein [Pogonatum inflexum]
MIIILMRLNLSFIYLYNMIIISLEIETFEYYYVFPLLKEMLNHWGYTSNLSIFNKITQETLINIYHLIKWIFFFHIYYIYFYNYSNNKFDQILNFYFQLKKNLYYKKYITTQCKKKNFQNIKSNKLKKMSEILLFFLNNSRKKIQKNFRVKEKNSISFFNNIKNVTNVKFFYFFFKFILFYKRWRANKLYIKMAYIAYCENLLDFSIKLFKMARFEKQMSFFLNSYLNFFRF